MFRGIFLFSFVLFLVASAQAKTIYIPQDYQAIQQGINAAINGDTVFVAPGTYVENIDFKGKAISVKSSGGATVTVIDGNEAGRVVEFRKSEGKNSVLDGFTVTNGNSDKGGGIYCYGSSPIIKNNVVTGNSVIDSGGGIWCRESSSPTITNNTISGNTAGGNGGGIACSKNSHPVITNNTISDNAIGHSGGGIYCGVASPTITNNTISGNTAETGGGIRCYLSSSTITNNTITGNTAQTNGGGIYCYQASPDIISNTITGNSADYGGGIHCSNPSSPTIKNNIITGNVTAISGGGIYCLKVSPDIASNTITGNTSWDGGGIFCSDSSPIITNNTISGNLADNGYGGGIYCNDSTSAITNNTISGNQATKGGGIWCDLSPPTITNTILWDNSAPTGPEIYGSPIINNSDVKGGWTGTGNIDADPLFVDPVNNNFHLTWRSPCINRGANDGAPSKDFEGDSRPYMGTVDMGVDEFTGIHALELEIKVFFLSESIGGSVDFILNGGAGNGKENYIILGSITGNAPGQPLPGGNTMIPINWDIFTLFVLQFINTPIFPNFMGTLLPDGTGTAAFDTLGPMPSGLAGQTFSFAYAVQAPGWPFVSNPINILVTQ